MSLQMVYFQVMRDRPQFFILDFLKLFSTRQKFSLFVARWILRIREYNHGYMNASVYFIQRSFHVFGQQI